MVLSIVPPAETIPTLVSPLLLLVGLLAVLLAVQRLALVLKFAKSKYFFLPLDGGEGDITDSPTFAPGIVFHDVGELHIGHLVENALKFETG